MAASILSSLLSKPALSIVSSQTGIDIATNLKVSRVRFRYRSRVMRHMREDGTSIVDQRVILATVVELDVFCVTQDDLAAVNSAMLDRTGVYKITSKGLIVQNMMSEENQIKQTPEVISANPVHIVFKQLLTQNGTNPASVEQSADSSLLDKGIQQLQTAAISVQTFTSNVSAQFATAAAGAAKLGGTFFLDNGRLDGPGTIG
jgi:hypothetical protein